MDKKKLNKVLADFAYDLANHCAIVERGRISLPIKGLEKLIGDYLDKFGGQSTSVFKFPEWYSEEDYKDDPVVWAVTEEFIQQEAESEIGRKLTGTELHRLFHCWFDDEDVDWARMEMVREAINRVVSGDEDWSHVDRSFLMRKYKLIPKSN